MPTLPAFFPAGAAIGFNVRYSGWIDPHLADSSRAIGSSAAYWASTPGPPDERVCDGLAPRRRRESELDLALAGQRDVLAVGAMRW